jgi:hypothetical protein
MKFGGENLLHAGRPAVRTGLNDALKTFILMSYEYRV